MRLENRVTLIVDFISFSFFFEATSPADLRTKVLGSAQVLRKHLRCVARCHLWPYRDVHVGRGIDAPHRKKMKVRIAVAADQLAQNTLPAGVQGGPPRRQPGDRRLMAWCCSVGEQHAAFFDC